MKLFEKPPEKPKEKGILGLFLGFVTLVSGVTGGVCYGLYYLGLIG